MGYSMGRCRLLVGGLRLTKNSFFKSICNEFMKIILTILFTLPFILAAQTWNNQTLSSYVRTLQGQASTAAGKNTTQDASISTLTTKVNSQANIITIQNSTIAT